MNEPQQNESADLARFIADRCAEKKALDIRILDMSGALALADYFVICSALSERQCRVIAQHCDQAMKSIDHYRAPPMEGVNTGNWICADFGEIILHVFTEDQRVFYDLEDKWGDVPRLEWQASADLKIDETADEPPESDFDIY